SWAVFAILMLAYSLTACRTVQPGDSTEFASALASWGVPHAPGYPLLSLLGNCLTHLFRGPDPAFVLNMMNASFAAAACAILAGATTTLTGSSMAGVLSGLILGSSRIFWQQALGVEVFSLNALFAAMALLLLARI